MPKLSTAEKEEQARLSEEIEHFTQQADDLLGEVVSKRKDYPFAIVKLKENRIREKFAHLLESPLLSVSSPAHIDVEELNKTIAMKVDQTKIHSEKVEDIRKENEKLDTELATVQRQTNMLLAMLDSGKYAPIDALPTDLSL
ncbi:unnamed protein product [Cylicocyclus nassatus]|uniref:Uncharacterized protein n=1 Tax=Cylicocyclus nassatus TaxID=53992 RepID=A0AA36GEA1_CYLNA|nr:unnamed protein product [Cylicocyclus nassatus]